MTYEYICPSCHITIYVERSIHSEASTPMCRFCEIEAVRNWSATPVHFKGTGFYSTDN